MWRSHSSLHFDVFLIYYLAGFLNKCKKSSTPFICLRLSHTAILFVHRFITFRFRNPLHKMVSKKAQVPKTTKQKKGVNIQKSRSHSTFPKPSNPPKHPKRVSKNNSQYCNNSEVENQENLNSQKSHAEAPTSNVLQVSPNHLTPPSSPTLPCSSTPMSPIQEM